MEYVQDVLMDGPPTNTENVYHKQSLECQKRFEKDVLIDLSIIYLMNN